MRYPNQLEKPALDRERSEVRTEIQALAQRFFGLSLGVLQIVSGLIVGHTAWEMVTVRRRLTNIEQQDAADKVT
jgi:hypothetical protein